MVFNDIKRSNLFVNINVFYGYKILSKIVYHNTSKVINKIIFEQFLTTQNGLF